MAVLFLILGVGALGTCIADLFIGFMSTWLFYVVQVIGWILLGVGQKLLNNDNN
jgi:hypothetical protein